MSVDKSTDDQILVAWRGTRWIVAHNTVEIGAYAYRNHAMARARALAVEIHREGRHCYILIREKDGGWIERPCPRGAAAPRG